MPNYMDDLFKALKSFPNRTFVDYVVRLEDDWEANNGGKTLEEEVEILLTKVRNKYNNMVSRDTWVYVDPNEAKILALTVSTLAEAFTVKPTVLPAAWRMRIYTIVANSAQAQCV